MLKLAYSTNGITNVDFFQAAKEIEKAGFDGVEISFQKKQFNPFLINDEFINKVNTFFRLSKIVPVAISTGTTYFLSESKRDDPSIMDLDVTERNRCIDCIKREINLAKKLNIPIVSFQTGYLRDGQVKSKMNARKILIDSINKCLENIGDVTLVIEPKPGMFIEALDDGTELVKEINARSFGLHLNIGDTYCTGINYIRDIALATPYIKYVHLADIKEGYNLKILEYMDFEEFKNDKNIKLEKNIGCIVLLKKQMNFLFFDKDNAVFFYHDKVEEQEKKVFHRFSMNGKSTVRYVDLNVIYDINVSQDKEREVQSYIDSIPKLNSSMLKSFLPSIRYLRSQKNDFNQLFIDKPVCNKVSGMAYYRECLGNGLIDFKSALGVLSDASYDGYITVELYNHGDVWKTVIPDSFNYLKNIIDVEHL
ncbi:MAG: TIM barrel protein [Alphaproteobacteria bacterium]|nr:TIM barrel protein [Alphaproteobacteria bacterium]